MRPKYQRIAQELELTLAGQPNCVKLPTEAELCAQFQCSRQTVRAALALLEDRGLIKRRQGSGAFPTIAAVRKSRQIVLFLPDRLEYLAPATLREARKTAQESGYILSCLETHGSREKEGELLGQLLRQRPAGIIVQPITDVLGCLHPELLYSIRDAGIPAVYLGGRYDDTFPAIMQDEAAGAGILTAHLAAAGHKEVAAILKWDDNRGLLRFRGMEHSAQQMGLSFTQPHCLWYSEQQRLHLLSGSDALLRLFLREYRGQCTAVVCFNDEIAFRLQRLTTALQEEISIVSFDNSYLARDASITSLGCQASPPAAAVAVILSRLTGRAFPPPVLPWKLYLRRSG